MSGAWWRLLATGRREDGGRGRGRRGRVVAGKKAPNEFPIGYVELKVKERRWKVFSSSSGTEPGAPWPDEQMPGRIEAMYQSPKGHRARQARFVRGCRPLCVATVGKRLGGVCSGCAGRPTVKR